MFCVTAETVITILPQYRQFRRSGKALSVESELILVQTLIHICLDICNSVLACSPWSVLQQLQYMYVELRCSLESLVCMIMFGCLHSYWLAPAFLDDYC